jgi:hypothetical protein
MLMESDAPHGFTRRLGGLALYFADKIAFAVGLIAGFQIPAFVSAYRQRLGGRLDQARIDLDRYQEIAVRFHDGDLDSLIQHHLRSADSTFLAEGKLIEDLIEQVRSLSEAYAALDAGLLHQIVYLATHLDADIARATWAAYDFGLVFTLDAIACAAVLGLAFSVFIHLLAGLLRRVFIRKTAAGAA